MKKLNPVAFVLFAPALAFGFFLGCNHPESVELGNDKEIHYDYETKGIDQIKMTAPTSAVDPQQEQWLERYNSAKQKPVAAKPQPRQAKPIAPPMADQKDIDSVTARVTFLKGSVKKAPNGAVTAITLSSSGSDPQTSVTQEDMQAIGRLFDLESLSLEGDSFDDAKIAELAQLKKLQSLTINNAGIQTASLELLAQLPELTSLDIRRDLKLDNSSLTALAAFPKLEKLYAYYNSFTNSGMAKISKVPTLKVVDVRGCPDVSDNGAKYLARLPELEEVYFRGMITNTGVENLSAAPKLRFIEFQDCNEINADSVPSFQKMAALRELRIFRCKAFDDAAVAGIAAIPFERLELRDLNLSNAALNSLAVNKTLKVLELSELPGVDQAGLAAFFQTLPALDELVLFTMPVDTNALSVLSERAPDLKQLTLRAVSLTDEAVNHILGLKNLEELDLRQNDQCSPESLMRLQELPSLKRLYLSGTSLSKPENADSLAALRKALPKCRVVN